MTIHWLVDESLLQPAADPAAFLHPSEMGFLSRRLAPKRRSEWLHGRWTAKRLLQASHPDCQDLPLAEILIASEPGGAPYPARADGTRLPGSLSLSHSGPLVACALTLVPGWRVGIDVELVEPRSPGFFDEYFTPAESRAIASLPPPEQAAAITRVWSTKEALFKALALGLAVDTRAVETRPLPAVSGGPGGGWQGLAVQGSAVAGLTCEAWWRPWQGGGQDYILTIAVLG